MWIMTKQHHSVLKHLQTLLLGPFTAIHISLTAGVEGELCEIIQFYSCIPGSLSFSSKRLSLSRSQSFYFLSYTHSLHDNSTCKCPTATLLVTDGKDGDENSQINM